MPERKFLLKLQITISSLAKKAEKEDKFMPYKWCFLTKVENGQYHHYKL